jgi:hypothetical protein
VRDTRNFVSGRGRNEASANTAPLMKHGQRLGSGGDLFGRPGRPAQHPYQLVAALDREQLDRTTGERNAPISGRAPIRKLQPERRLSLVRLTCRFSRVGS